MQTRALAYTDTQRYRLGTNFIQLPVNRPAFAFNPIRRDGQFTLQNLGSTPNTFPSSFVKYGVAAQFAQPDEEHWLGTVIDFESALTDKDFVQPRIFWERTLAKEPGQQDDFVSNVSGHLAAAVESVRKATYGKLMSIHLIL